MERAVRVKSNWFNFIHMVEGKESQEGNLHGHSARFVLEIESETNDISNIIDHDAVKRFLNKITDRLDFKIFICKKMAKETMQKTHYIIRFISKLGEVELKIPTSQVVLTDNTASHSYIVQLTMKSILDYLTKIFKTEARVFEFISRIKLALFVGPETVYSLMVTKDNFSETLTWSSISTF